MDLDILKSTLQLLFNYRYKLLTRLIINPETIIPFVQSIIFFR